MIGVVEIQVIKVLSISRKLVHGLRILGFVYLFLLTLPSRAERVQLDLYGHVLPFEGSKPGFHLNSPITQNQLKEQIAGIKLKQLSQWVAQLDEQAQNFGMDDLAYLQMLKKLSNQLTTSPLDASLLNYLLLKEKGYRVILGFAPDKVTTYANLDFKVHNVLYVEKDGLVFTDVSFESNQEPCQEELFEEASGGRAITMNESRPPYFDALSGKYVRHFEFEGMIYQFEGQYNRSLVAYYNELPDIEFGQVYLNYKISESGRQALVMQLRKSIEGMFPAKQIDFLLKFAQEAIPYKRDMESQGKEKFSFPEEVLASSYADCEDKSVLFAYLAKEVLDLPSVALIYYYDHHLNVGVAFNHKTAWNFIYNNQKYLVCEPSGLGFKPGDNAYDLDKASIVNW